VGARALPRERAMSPGDSTCGGASGCSGSQLASDGLERFCAACPLLHSDFPDRHKQALVGLAREAADLLSGAGGGTAVERVARARACGALLRKILEAV